MILKLAKSIVFSRTKKTAGGESSVGSRNVPPGQAQNSTSMPTGAPQWDDVLTRSLKENALAPSDEVILHAFDLYCDELNAPFHERRRAMNERFSKVVSAFAELQALAPEMVEAGGCKAPPRTGSLHRKERTQDMTAMRSPDGLDKFNVVLTGVEHEAMMADHRRRVAVVVGFRFRGGVPWSAGWRDPVRHADVLHHQRRNPWQGRFRCRIRAHGADSDFRDAREASL